MQTIKYFLLLIILISTNGTFAQSLKSNYSPLGYEPLPFLKSFFSQSPDFKKPIRGSIAGDWSEVAHSNNDSITGDFKLQLPLNFPNLRGPLLVDIAPIYSPAYGQSEWGMGFQNQLVIYRYREIGNIDYANDDLMSPWGQLVRGNSGFYYPKTFQTHIKVQLINADEFKVYLPDGSTMKFGGAGGFTKTAQGTYSWYLTEVQNLIGQKTLLKHMSNATGVLYLNEVLYGGHNDNFQYQIQLQYEELKQKTFKYNSGERKDFDKRITQIAISVLDTDQQFKNSYKYLLSYQVFENSPKYFLKSLQKIYTSGAAEPPVSFKYDDSEDFLKNTKWELLSHFDSLMNDKDLIFQPDFSAQVDLEDDGQVEFETVFDSKLIRISQGSYSIETLPPYSDNLDPRCRARPEVGRTSHAHQFARLGGPKDVPTPVIASPQWIVSNMLICNREGSKRGEITLEGNWDSNKDTRLVDLNNDGKPDLIRLLDDGFGYAINQTLPGQNYQFSREVDIYHLGMPAIGASVQDINGDGIPDLITKRGTGIFVWHGMGNFKFEQKGVHIPFFTNINERVPSVSPWTMGFADVNHDGLPDVFLGNGNFTELYLNNGDYFIKADLNQLSSVMGFTPVYPIIADLKASGNTQIAITSNRHIYVLELEQASTGLMIESNDGKGTVINYEYSRMAPTPEAGYRIPLLTKRSVHQTGSPEIQTTFAYSEPKVHSQFRRFLGFGAIETINDQLITKTNFWIDDFTQGLPTAQVTQAVDQPNLLKFTNTEYEYFEVDGKNGIRLKSEENGWFSTNNNKIKFAKKKEYLKYDQNFCSAATVTHNDIGDLIEESTMATPEALANHFACLPSEVKWTGQHRDTKQYDFTHQLKINRDGQGLPIELGLINNEKYRALQKINYDEQHQIKNIFSPIAGTIEYQFDANYRLSTIKNPTGHIIKVNDWESTNDGIKEQSEIRGLESAPYTQFFRFNDRQALASQWTSLSEGKEDQPDIKYQYTYANENDLGRIETQKRFYLQDTDAAYTQELEIFNAGGATLAHLEKSEQTWFLKNLVRYDIAQQKFTYGSKIFADPASITQWQTASLYDGTDELSYEAQSGFGMPKSKRARYSQKSIGTMDFNFELDPSGIFQTQIFNAKGSLATDTHTRINLENKVTEQLDQDGNSTQYVYDLLGRLRKVKLPKQGSEAIISYDIFGDRTTIQRTGVGSIQFVFDSASGLLSQKVYGDKAGKLERSIIYQYDNIARVTQESHQDSAGVETAKYEFLYDGQSFDNLVATPGQLGFLTGVRGKGFTKSGIFRGDGKLTQEIINFSDWSQIKSTYLYNIDGAPLERRVEWLPPVPLAIQTSKTLWKKDALGRLSEININDKENIKIQYDGFNTLTQVTLPDNEVIHFIVDPVTQTMTGINRNKNAKTFAQSWNFDDYGRIDSESFSHEGSSLNRSFNYSRRGFLIKADEQYSFQQQNGASAQVTPMPAPLNNNQSSSSQQSNTQYSYTYDTDGLLQSSSKNNAILDTTQGTSNPDQWTYGDHGRISKIIKANGDRINFLYDENGKRLLKLKNDRVVEAYISDAVVTAAGFIQQVKVASTVIGVNYNGHFYSLNTDMRGSLTHSDNGSLDVASPYGERSTQRSQFAQTIDFATSGYDADLKAYRMDHRDYDPRLKRFLTADPLFLENPEKCVDSPVECNLYSYAGNDPINFTDPKGTCAEPISGTVCAVAAAAPIAAEVVGSAVLSAYTIYQAVMSANDGNGGDGKGFISNPGITPPRQDASKQEWHEFRAGSGRYSESAATGERLKNDLRLQSARSVFTEDGKLTAEVVKNSDLIMESNKIKNPLIPFGFDKYSTQTFQSPLGDFQVHFYMNLNGDQFYDRDFKVKFNSGKLGE